MSSTIKRVALVAVAALGLGSVTALSANATVPTLFKFVTAEAIGADTDTAVTVAGASNYVEIASKVDSAAVARVDVTGGTFVDITETVHGAGTAPAATVSYNSAATSAFMSSTDIYGDAATEYIKLRINTPTAGTVTIKVYTTALVNGVSTDTLVDTLTATVNTAATANVYSSAKSTVYGSSDATAAATATTEAALATSPASASKTYNGTTEVFRVDAAQLDANGTNLASGFKTTTATITGVGTLGLDTNAPLAPSVSEAAQASDFYVFADGRVGVGTLSIYVNSVLIKTYTITFYGPVATISVKSVKSSLSDASDATIFATLSAKDSAGNAVPLAGTDGSPSTTNGTFTDANGTTAGTVDVSLDATADSLGAKTTVWTHTATGVTVDLSVLVAKAAASTISIVGPSDTLVPGQKYTVTVTSKDANGYANPDGSRNLTIATSRASSVTVPTSGAFVNGVASIDLYAPATAGDFTLTITDATVTTATATVSVAVSNASQDAIDAANEATDAANAATDAANAAAEAADAATAAAQDAQAAAMDAQAAVAALATQVASLIAGIKAQITTLTNLVIKIQKKVKA